MTDNHKKRRNYLIATIILGSIVIFAIMYFFSPTSQITQGNPAENFQKRMDLQPFLIIAIFCLASMNFTISRYKKLNSGIKGEENTQKLLSNLPNSYIVKSNIPLIHEGKRAEIDNLIISERGLVIVETKNYSGRLSGSSDSTTWTQVKYSRSGHRYEKDLKNPIKQVNRQTWILSQILKNNGICCWIDSVVYIQQAECDFEDKKLFTNPQMLVNYILTLGKPNSLSQKDIAKIQTILSNMKETMKNT